MIRQTNIYNVRQTLSQIGKTISAQDNNKTIKLTIRQLVKTKRNIIAQTSKINYDKQSTNQTVGQLTK